MFRCYMLSYLHNTKVDILSYLWDEKEAIKTYKKKKVLLFLIWILFYGTEYQVKVLCI